MSEIDPGGRKCLLIGAREVDNVSKCGDLDGTFDPIGPNGGSDAMGDLKDIDGGRQATILEIPPDGDLNVPAILLMSARVVGRVVMGGGGKRGELEKLIARGLCGCV